MKEVRKMASINKYASKIQLENGKGKRKQNPQVLGFVFVFQFLCS